MSVNSDRRHDTAADEFGEQLECVLFLVDGWGPGG